jgi:hypothetical protein
VSTGATHQRTLWEEGRKPAPLVVLASAALMLLVVLVDLLAFNALTAMSDVAFVLVCAAAALAVRPREFFVVGVLPPLLLASVVGFLAVRWRDAVADPADGLGQAVVSGLAHHAEALVVGYALTLALLALRQVALRNAGVLRRTGGR